MKNLIFRGSTGSAVCDVATAIVLSGACILSVWLMAPPKARAASDEEAMNIVKAMIEAHGGMEKWQSAPTVSFLDEFLIAGAPEAMVSRVTVEQGRRRVYIDYPAVKASLAWDGQRAWSVDWQMPTPPRFLAQLNYYFANLVWLTMDPGVNLKHEGTAKLWDDPTEYITVRMTFDEGVGDTPDDYYVLWIHPETAELRACTYTVTYVSILPEGMESTPEHILVYDEYAMVSGLKVPTHYTIYETDQSEYASCRFRNWSFSKPFDESRMTMPEGAVLDESAP